MYSEGTWNLTPSKLMLPLYWQLLSEIYGKCFLLKIDANNRKRNLRKWLKKELRNILNWMLNMKRR